MHKNRKRHRITAMLLMLFLLASCILPQPASAAISEEADKQMDNMGKKIFAWYKGFLAVIIPLLIVKLASCGISILGTVFLAKGEFQMDAIKKEILYSIIASGILYLLPTIVGWAMDLASPTQWTPSYSCIILWKGRFLW